MKKKKISLAKNESRQAIYFGLIIALILLIIDIIKTGITWLVIPFNFKPTSQWMTLLEFLIIGSLIILFIQLFKEKAR